MRTNNPESIGQFDYVIVGGGSAGCVLANRLSADPRNRVLLLEAGGKDDWIWFHVPVGYLFAMGNPRADWGFKTEPEPGLGGRAINYPRGKVLGGCSSINGMIYMRGQARDYDHWRQLGNEGWGWEDVKPLFLKAEDHHAGANDDHGAAGEWRVEPLRLSWRVLDLFRAAAAEQGIAPLDDFNRGDNEGCGYFQVNQRRGRRLSAAGAFLHPVKRRPNLRVVTAAQATRLLFNGKRAVGLEFHQHGRLWRAEAQGEIVLAAGALGSPQLLMLSGVGAGADLQRHGLELLHEAPDVGANLQDHLQLRMVFKVSGLPTLNQQAASLARRGLMALDYALRRRGPLTMAPSQLGAFARSGPEQASANLEYHVQPLSLDRFGEPLHPFPAFTASVCNLRPTSRGSVSLRSADPLAPPAIAPNYLATAEDRRVAADAIALTRRIVLGSVAFKPHQPEEFRPGPQYRSAEELAAAAGVIGTTIFHPVGTCRMGPDVRAVVDVRLRVKGLTGLRVADASVMPSITSGNTAAPTMMIAEKAAAMILADRVS